MRLAASRPLLLLALTIGGWATMRSAYVAIGQSPPADDNPMPGLLFPIGLDDALPGAGSIAMAHVLTRPPQVRPALVTAAPSAKASAAVGTGPQAITAPNGGADASSPFVAAQIALLRHMLRPGRSERWSMQRFMAEPDSLPPASAGAANLQQRGFDDVPSRWAASAWALYRAGTGPVLSLARQGRLGGSQAGLRLSYRLSRNDRLQAFGRLTATPGLDASAETALGLAWRPLPRVPVTAVVERRQEVAGRDGRSAFAAYVTGGVSDASLPAGFTLDAYGAAGVVGLRNHDGFAEASIRAVRPVANLGPARLGVGGGAWAAAQPGASRVDIGPVLVTRIGTVGGLSPRLALDYRARVAGDSTPRSGVALTISADF